MENTKSLLTSRFYPITKKISLIIPTIGEILEDENLHYSMISNLIATPYDLMVQFDDAGIDYETIDEFELFIKLFQDISQQDTSLIFGDLDLKKFSIGENTLNNQLVLYNKEDDILIDKLIWSYIIKAIEKIYLMKRNQKSAGNSAAKVALIHFNRKKQQQIKEENSEPYLESLVVSLVNTQEFKYNFETVQSLNIYAFNKSLLKVQKVKDYEIIMTGAYSGNIDMTKIDKDKLNWLS